MATLVNYTCESFIDIDPSIYYFPYTKAGLKRRTSHVPNLMQISENNKFFSLALDLAREKFDV